jgi:hypothetical protein
MALFRKLLLMLIDQARRISISIPTESTASVKWGTMS